MKDLNFFEPYLGRKKEKTNTKIYVYGAIVIVGLVVFGTLAVDSIKLIILDKNIEDYNNKLSESQLQKDLKEADNINKQLTTLKQYDSALNDVAISVKKRDNVSDTLLNDIGSTVPSEVSFKNLDITDNTVVIKGVSTKRAAVAELKHNLSGLSNMQDVYVNSIDDSGTVEGAYSFDIKCVLKDVG